MRLTRFGFVAIVTLVASAAHAIGGVLIVQEMVKPDRVGDPNVSVANSLAEAVEKEGLYSPVVWSLTDPIFRAAVNEGMRVDPEKVPEIAQAVEVAKRLKLESVIYVRAYQFGNSVMGRIQLFRAGKLVWKDPEKGTELMDPNQKLQPTTTTDKNGKVTQHIPKPETIQTEDRPMSVMGPNGLLLEDSALSLVRTWVSLLKSGPFKGQGTQPKILTPDPLPGTNTVVPSEAIVPPVKDKVDNKQLLADLDAMVRGGQTIPGILMLRDAVDAEPQDVERRIALVRTLLLVGQAELAANEARRAAELIPDKPELRAMAARAWMQAGREDEAMADLNEAVARDPNSFETRSLLAEVNIAKLRPRQALEHLDAITKEKPTADTWFKKAICHTMLGDKAAAADALAKAKEAGLGQSAQEVASRYNVVLDVLDKSVAQMGVDLRSILNQAQVQRTSPDVKTGFNNSSIQVSAWTQFLMGIGAPGLHRSSHDQRVLALNLLTQSLGDLGTYLASNDMDMLTDSRINLGEALKQYTLAQTSYQKEIGGNAKSVGSR